MMKRLTKRIMPNAGMPQKVGGKAIAIGMRLLLKSLNTRIGYYDISVDPARSEYSEHCIFVFWHEYLSILVAQYSQTPVTMLLSQHRDAEWLNHAANFLRFNVVRGSSTRGGSAAIREIKKYGDISSFAIACDGPKGPRHHLALGPLYLASKLQMPLVPVGVGFSKPWRLNTWDKFAIPRPGSRARVIFGPKIRIPARLKKEPLEKIGTSVQKLLHDITRFSEFWAESNCEINGQKAFEKVRSTNALRFDNTNMGVLNLRRAA